MTMCARAEGANEGRQAVTLWRQDQGLRVAPAVEPALRVLRAFAHVAVVVPGRGHEVRAVPVPLGAVKVEGGQPMLYTRATLGPAVELTLASAGYAVRRYGDRPEPLPAPRPEALLRFDRPDLSLLELVRRHEWGLIRYEPAAVHPARLIAQVALAWPALRVAVAVGGRSRAVQLARELRAFLPAVSILTGRDSPAAVERVVVATYTGLGHTATYPGPRFAAFDVSWLDVVIVPDAVEASGKLPIACLSRARRARLYGLLEAGARPAPLDRDHLTALFGFEEVVIPRHGHRERPVRVVRPPVQGGPGLTGPLDLVQLKRRGLWQNGLRNRRVARLARALAADQRRELADLLPGCSDLLTDVPARGVLVVVENVEHGLALAGRLPGWPLWAGPDVDAEGLAAGQRRRLLTALPDPFRADPPQAVVTAAALADAELSRADVLVRADGGVGLPPLGPESLVEPDAGPVRPLLIVDPFDRQHPALRRRSRLRQQAYLERGWLAPGADPVRARVEDFLAGRRDLGEGR
jgi:hypothetical protein